MSADILLADAASTDSSKKASSEEGAEDEPSAVGKYVATVIAVLMVIVGGALLAVGISNFVNKEKWMDPSGNGWKSFGNWLLQVLLPVAGGVLLLGVGGKILDDRWRRGATTIALMAGRAVTK